MSDRLDEAVAKIKRAKQQLRALDRSIKRAAMANAYGMRSEFHAESGEYRLFGYLAPGYALRWSVVAGEVIHHARSALEYAIWQGVLATGATPREGITGFPLVADEDDFQIGRNGGRSGWQLLGGVSPDVAEIVIGFQPFGPQFDQDPLWLMNELWKRDKHRALNVITALFRDVEVVGALDDIVIHTRYGSGRESSIASSGFTPRLPISRLPGPIEAGVDEVWITAEPETQFGVVFASDIAFGEAGPWVRKPLRPTLAMLIERAELVIQSLQPYI